MFGFDSSPRLTYPLGLVKQVVEEDAHWKSNRLAVYFGSQNSKLAHDPEKHALGPRPDG
jgi:hypothetical protein